MSYYIGFIIVFIFINTHIAHSQTYIAELEKFREQYKRDLLADDQLPLDADDIQHLHFYAIDSNYRVVAQAERIHDPVPLTIPTYSGITKKYIRYAQLKFYLFGQHMELTLYKSVDLLNNPMYADYLFLPFTDRSNGDESYEGGRYIDLKTQDFKGNAIVLDFNKAYNPYCAYSEGYNCPIPPKENTLPIEIKAGEKKYTGKHKQRI